MYVIGGGEDVTFATSLPFTATALDSFFFSRPTISLRRWIWAARTKTTAKHFLGFQQYKHVEVTHSEFPNYTLLVDCIDTYLAAR